MPDAIEYVSEEKAAKISRNPDWQCSFCGSLNSDDLNICKNCGATKEDSERNYFEIRKQEEEKKRKKEEKKETHQKNTAKSAPKKKEKKKKSLMKRALLFLGIFAVIIFGMMSCLAPKVKNVTIDDFDWERTIDIEEIVTHSESDWQLPDDARLQYTKNEIKTAKADSFHCPPFCCHSIRKDLPMAGSVGYVIIYSSSLAVDFEISSSTFTPNGLIATPSIPSGSCFATVSASMINALYFCSLSNFTNSIRSVKIG